MASMVKHVQEVPINRYGGSTYASLSSSILIIDLHLLSSSNTKEREEEMEKLKLALTSLGCFQAIGHDIPSSLLDKLHNMAKEFFQLSMAEKCRCSINDDGSHVQGCYKEGYGNNAVRSKYQVLDRQYLSLKVKPDDERRLKLWPENPNGFREILHEYGMKASLVNQIILKSMAELVGLEENYFVYQLAGERSQCFARYNYYPPCSGPDIVYGIGPHSDAGAITILLQDKQVEGLQVLKDEQWINVPVVPHALLINLADQIEIMSNGVFKSLIHRVILNSERERISLALFFAPEMEKDIEPAAKLIDESRPSLFQKVNMRDYAINYVQRNLQGKRAIEWAKV